MKNGRIIFTIVAAFVLFLAMSCYYHKSSSTATVDKTTEAVVTVAEEEVQPPKEAFKLRIPKEYKARFGLFVFVKKDEQFEPKVDIIDESGNVCRELEKELEKEIFVVKSSDNKEDLILPGDKEPGDKEPGDKEPGDKEPGDKEPGDKEPGDKEPGDKEPGDKEPGDKEPGDKEPGDKEPGDKEPGDKEPEKVDPDYTVPTIKVTYKKDLTLQEIHLPNGFSWEYALSTKVGDVGTKTFPATYTPMETEKYNVVKGLLITVIVQKARYDDPILESKTFAQDGSKKYLEATNVAEGIKITYNGNGQSEPGHWKVVAHFEGDSKNYFSIPDKIAYITIIGDTPPKEGEIEGPSDGGNNNGEDNDEPPKDNETEGPSDGGTNQGQDEGPTDNLPSGPSGGGNNTGKPSDVSPTTP